MASRLKGLTSGYLVNRVRVLVRDSQRPARVWLEELEKSRSMWETLWPWNSQDLLLDWLWVEEEKSKGRHLGLGTE